MTVMYDNASDGSGIPANAPIVAGYINGRFAWSAAAWAAFPTAQKVRIQIFIPGQPITGDGDVIDIEANDAETAIGQAAAVQWCALKRAAGVIPAIYTSRSTQAPLLAGGVSGTVNWWLADYTGSPHLLPGTVATQWASPDTGSGGPYDVSETDGTWPGLGANVQQCFIQQVSSQIGVPYLFGGDTPAGFDCSGLMFWAAGNCGVTIPRTSEDQFPAIPPVSGTPMAGDLVFINSHDDQAPPSHVGMCTDTGCTQMIDAPHTGAFVRQEAVAGFGDVMGYGRLPGVGPEPTPGPAPLPKGWGLGVST